MPKPNYLHILILVLVAFVLPGCAGRTVPRSLNIAEGAAVGLDVVVDREAEQCREVMDEALARCDLLEDDEEAIACVRPAKKIGQKCKEFVDALVPVQEVMASAIPELRKLWAELEALRAAAGAGDGQ